MPVDSMQKQKSRNVGPEIAGGLQSEVFYPPARPARISRRIAARVKAREMRGPINESPMIKYETAPPISEARTLCCGRPRPT